ncbi:uncharacterized protein A1O5_07967 [Cladophialophora psammophila CBS 110553]|uniref:Uncharacterized protein n=1 Tax=Cladophialophora psammophila CBS 110553 TaxID=1182543 RepID=W9WLI7_9EURO|nr:uncharacterized protein A1O5_07967 [Cladophialophora psammophila CBS 110553]EXJ69032.1 hypothetical protein A1O5_07967 [Cladophialophora psammophila CBS 110553]
MLSYQSVLVFLHWKHLEATWPSGPDADQNCNRDRGDCPVIPGIETKPRQRQKALSVQCHHRPGRNRARRVGEDE